MLIDREMSKDRKFKSICRRFGVVIKIPTINYLFPHSKKSNLGGQNLSNTQRKLLHYLISNIYGVVIFNLFSKGKA